MIEIKGKFNSAKIFTDNVEQEAIAQIIALCNQPFTQGQTIRMMPDIHAGSGCTVGTTMTITDKAVPNIVGVDIGCGMETVILKEKHIELQKLDKLIYRKIPSGFAISTKNKTLTTFLYRTHQPRKSRKKYRHSRRRKSLYRSRY